MLKKIAWFIVGPHCTKRQDFPIKRIADCPILWSHSLLGKVPTLQSGSHQIKEPTANIKGLPKLPISNDGLVQERRNSSASAMELCTVDSRYLAPVGSQNSRARVKWFSRYLALSREGHDSRSRAKATTREFRITDPHSQTVCWAIIEVLTFPGSLHTSTSHQRQITTSNIRF